MTNEPSQEDYILTNEAVKLLGFNHAYHSVPPLPERCISIAPYTNANGLVQCVKTGGHRSKVHRSKEFTWDDRLSARGIMK